MAVPEETERSRIVIADDHPLYRDALKRMLSEASDFSVVGEAADGREALDLCRRLHPALVLMDVRMPVMDGIAATREIKRELPLTIVLMLTALEDPELLSEALKAGAAGYVLKYALKEELVDKEGAKRRVSYRPHPKLTTAYALVQPKTARP